MEQNIANLTTTGMKSGVPSFSVSSKTLDEPGAQNVNHWDSPNFTVYLGYLKQIPEIRNASYALAKWTCGLGWSASPSDTVLLENIRGWGKESFDSIMQDMLVISDINGDSFAEIIRNDNGTLINLKKLNPNKTRIWYDDKGMIIKYSTQKADGTWEDFQIHEIFHLCNDRIANEIHGTSKLESCKFIIDWINEIFSDLRRLMHRSSLRVMYVDPDNTTKLSTLKEQYKEAIKNGEVLLIPGRKGIDAEVVDYQIPPTAAYIEVLNFATNYFYEVFGVPKIVTGGTEQFTEASSKVGLVTFEVPHKVKRRYLEQEIWGQLGIRIDFDEPASMMNNLQMDQAKNQSQVGFQPNDMMANRGKTA